MLSKLTKPRFDLFQMFFMSICVIFFSAILACAYTSTAQRLYEKHTYPETAMVIDVSETDNTVTVECANGNRFVFYETSDWTVGDIAALTMHDKGTATVYDDEIIDKEYAGYTDLFLKIEKQNEIK